jgi:uncharacterized protein (TIGR00251 family)
MATRKSLKKSPEGASCPLPAILHPASENSYFLNVYIQPKASVNRVAGLHDGALKISITAPPIDGKANKAVIAFIAKLLHISKASISICSGLQSRSKRLLISGSSPELAKKMLLQELENP